MEKIAHNQLQYLRSFRHKTKCRICKKQIVWMKTVDKRSIAVNPLKVQSVTPGEKIIGEDGIIMINTVPKVGWTLHQCPHADRRIGGMMLDRAQQPQSQAMG